MSYCTTASQLPVKTPESPQCVRKGSTGSGDLMGKDPLYLSLLLLLKKKQSRFRKNYDSANHGILCVVKKKEGEGEKDLGEGIILR